MTWKASSATSPWRFYSLMELGLLLIEKTLDREGSVKV